MRTLGVATTMRDNAPSYYLRFRSIFEALAETGKIDYHGMIKMFFGKFPRITFNRGIDSILIARIKDIKYLQKIFGLAADSDVPVIYETDDLLLFERRKDKPVENFHEISGYLKKASGIIASTHYLADELGKHNNRVFVFPNLLDPGIWDIRKPQTIKEKKYLNICCTGTGLMPENLGLIAPAIEYCEKKYDRSVIFTLWGNAGYIDKNLMKLKNIKIIDRKLPYKKYARELKNSFFDLAVAPLSDIYFNLAKSNIKYLEYSICGIPSLLSKIIPYRSLPEGKCCILVENDTESWLDSIIRMIENKEERDRISINAFEDVSNNYILNKIWLEKYLSILEEIIGRR